MSKQIIIFHTLNDFSGSPNILATVIRGLISRDYSIDLYTSSIQSGHLSGIRGVNYHVVYYRFDRNKVLTLLRFIILQLRYFFISLQFVGRKDVIFYINTILPFGAGLGARLIHKKVVYHVHENPVKRNIIHRIAVFIFLKCAHKAIFVSDYLYNSYKMETNSKILVYNALDPDFTKIAEVHKPLFVKPFNIMMASSLKVYKGIDVFVGLAEKLSDYHFVLALNANNSEIRKYFKRKILPSNLDLLPGTNDIHSLYSKANLVVNLSIPGQCIESFGLTILEAMTYGIPVIVPPAGGITELVEDGINGYKIDPLNQEELIKKINKIFSIDEKYILLSSSSRLMAKKFTFAGMIDEIDLVLKQL